MTSMGEKMSEQEVEDMIKEAAPNGDGRANNGVCVVVAAAGRVCSSPCVPRVPCVRAAASRTPPRGEAPQCVTRHHLIAASCATC
ncbi:hypothetical protein E2C01_052843 [Portunus trituberculatus]|uniref:Uncharacterized protein n=1 Tax=Portunus trituberculatus TaxID=210409 RepID=A0A5B7GMT4_PORTR|nr:hypothetical protein [Portunus trituberculatus]